MMPIDGPVLALDSSTRGASVAVGIAGRVVAGRVLQPSAGASSLLMPAVDAVVREAGLVPPDLAAVVVSGGPGSFTGLRIAAATAKALVRALGVPLFAYSGLLAAAATLRHAGHPACALFDARNREVFAGCWRFEGGAVDEVLAPAILTLEEAVERVAPVQPVFTGDGAALYLRELQQALGPASVEPHPDESPAAGLLWLASAVPERGRVRNPAAWEPEYLRASGAERIAAAKGA